MAKPKLFCWNDFLCNTGFAKVATHLYEDLHKDFDVHILGINYQGLQEYDTSKYFVHPISPDDPFGFKRMGYILNKLRPDVVFLFQDIFHIDAAATIVRKVLGPDVPIVAYYPIDGSPVSYAWKPAFAPGLINKHITYTKWAIDEIKSTFPEETKNLEIDYLYHGVESKFYYPLKPFPIKYFRKERGWTDKFVILNLNRFQPRKGIAATIRAFSMFRYGYYVDKDGYWFPRTAKRHPLQHYNMHDPGVIVDEVPGHDDAIFYLHATPNDQIFGPTKSCWMFAQMYNNGIKDDGFGVDMQIPPRDVMGDPYTEEEINELYNAVDVNITGALGEGCGLSLIESQFTGTTTIAPHNSAIPEMLGDHGYLCKNIAVYTQAMDSAHLRPLVDERELVKALETEYQKWVANGRRKVFNQEAYERSMTLFQWDDKKEYLKNVLLEQYYNSQKRQPPITV